ncbi:hypothetical protein CLHUN_09530 [Ruminiclostridium hungatei]|uniref:Uncharacterized protein n=1 Tax=Ruminiclostridium hungatei TaxID=48256 RepID=A0A1V4SP09_RUMHU|nr:hypothetical protein [Ruminiclostridium hungatei]OPX45574.1 hypothetical protein CLHUN_09530 [Ruminiclostridium hungatei]
MKISKLKPVKIISSIVKFQLNGEFTQNIVGKYAMSRFWGQRGKLIFRINSRNPKAAGISAGSNYLEVINNNFLHFSEYRPAIGILTREKAPVYHTREVQRPVPFYIYKAGSEGKTRTALSSSFIKGSTLLNTTTRNISRDKLIMPNGMEKQWSKLNGTVDTRPVPSGIHLFQQNRTEAENVTQHKKRGEAGENRGKVYRDHDKEPVFEKAPHSSAHSDIRTYAADSKQELKYFKAKSMASDILAEFQLIREKHEQINEGETSGRVEKPAETAAPPEQVYGPQRTETTYATYAAHAPTEHLRPKSLNRPAGSDYPSTINLKELLWTGELHQKVTEKTNKLLEHTYIQKVNAQKSFNYITVPQLTEVREVRHQGEEKFPAAVQADKEILGYLQKSRHSGLILYKPKQEKPHTQEAVQEESIIPARSEVKEKAFASPKAVKVSIVDSPEEVNLIAEKVFGILEKRLGIQKDRRGLR